MSVEELAPAMAAYTRQADIVATTNHCEQLRGATAHVPASRSSVWRRYHPIEQSSSDKALRSMQIEVAAKLGADCEWIASEKVHGSNFCLETDGVAVEYASRANKLNDGAQFMNANVTMSTYHPFALKAFQLAKEQIPTLSRLLIYGEYLGGYYPGHPVVKGSKTVQKGVAYSPSNHFYAFDVSLNGDGYMDFDEARLLLLAAGFPLVAAPLFRGSLNDVLAVDVESFKTTLPALLGHSPLDKFCIAEGIVIRPVREVSFGRNRVILKKKARAFWEATNQPGMAMKVAQQEAFQKGEPSSLEQIAFSAAKEYVNDNRIRSVVSKDPDLLAEGQQHKLAGLLTKDVLEDFEKEHEDELQTLGKGIANVRKAVHAFVRFYVSEHVAGIRAELA